MAFDDHATVVALEFLIKRLVVNRCLESTDPRAELVNWTNALAEQQAQTEQFALDHVEDVDMYLNATAGAGELERISQEIAADVVASSTE